MYGIQEAFDSKYSEMLSICETKEERQAFQKKYTEFVDEVVDEMSESILKTILKKAPDKLKATEKDRRQFERNLENLWGLPIRKLEVLIQIAREVGMEFNKKHRGDAAKSNDFVFESLVRLQARASHTSFAVLSLLRSGFADDAYARWRSLHEIAVVGGFIRENGQELAERYLLHEIIQQYKLACAQARVQGRIDAEEIPKQELEALKSRRDTLVERFGRKFKSDYGWATEALGGEHPSFLAIEKRTQLDHLRPYYRMASDNVHANSHGMYFRLGLNQDEKRMLLVSASTAGLADPGHSTAISLVQITVALLSTRPSIDTITTMSVLARLEDKIGKTFLESHKKHES